MSECQNMSDSLPLHTGDSGSHVSNPSSCAVSNPLHNLILGREIIQEGDWLVICFIILKEFTLIAFTLCWLLLYSSISRQLPNHLVFFVCCLEKVILFLNIVWVCAYVKIYWGWWAEINHLFRWNSWLFTKVDYFLEQRLPQICKCRGKSHLLFLPFPSVVKPTVNILVKCVRQLNRPLLEWFSSAIFIEVTILFRTSGWYYFWGGDWTNISS